MAAIFWHEKNSHMFLCSSYVPSYNLYKIWYYDILRGCFGSACDSGGHIYLCGGGWPQPTDVIEEYDIGKNEWIVSTMKLPQPLAMFTAAVVDFM